MSKDLKSPQQSEEVDLGQLFKLIGNAFDRLFSGFVSIFKGAFHLVILFLLFIQKYFLKFLVITIVGAAIGFYVDLQKETEYVSTMLIEPNFNSTEQLYSNVFFYNELAEAKDSTTLANVLGITTKEAKTLKAFEVEPYADKNQKIKLFNNFIRDLDTIAQKALDLEQYFDDFNGINLPYHVVSVIATNNTVAKRIQPVIIESVRENDYFRMQKKVSDANIKLQDSFYIKQTTEIDSLQKLYKMVMLKEADRDIAGTNISLSDNDSSENKEFALINKMEDLKAKLIDLNKERANKSNILNVISDFPRKGVKNNKFFKRYTFIMPCLFIGLGFLFFALFSLNNFLKNYRNA